MIARANVTVKMPLRIVNDLDRLVLERRLGNTRGRAVSRSTIINELLASALGFTVKPGAKTIKDQTDD